MRFAEGYPFYVLELLPRLFGCLLVVFGLPWGGLGEFLAPLGYPWASLGPLLARFGGAWEVSGELPAAPSALWRCLWLPYPLKTSKMEPPGTKMTRISSNQRRKFLKICTRILLQSRSLQRLSQRETQANSLKFVPDFFFKAARCSAFRKGKPSRNV